LTIDRSARITILQHVRFAIESPRLFFVRELGADAVRVEARDTGAARTQLSASVPAA
jgi:hypothetical protein